MTTSIKYYCVGYGGNGGWIAEGQQVNTMEEADVVIFPGGGDWNPSLYGQPRGSKTTYNDDCDRHQIEELIKAVELQKAIVGICRGAQLLCIAEGGTLIQHVTGHTGGDHIMYSTQGRPPLMTNTCHHQMLNLGRVDKNQWDLLYYAAGLSNTYLDGDDKEIFGKNVVSVKEPEVILFPHLRALGIQGHPEWHMQRQTEIELNRILRTQVLPLVKHTNWGVSRRLHGMLGKDYIIEYKTNPTLFTQVETKALPANIETNVATKKDWRSSIREIG